MEKLPMVLDTQKIEATQFQERFFWKVHDMAQIWFSRTFSFFLEDQLPAPQKNIYRVVRENLYT